MANPEFTMQYQICNYIRAQYPKAMFRSDLIALAKLPIQTASMMKKLQRCRGWMDLTIYEPMHHWNGLVMELKTDTQVIFDKAGKNIKKKELIHVLEQNANIQMMTTRGFIGSFFFGYENTRDVIDIYMSGSKEQIKEGLSNKLFDNLCTKAVIDNPSILLDESLDPFIARYYHDRLGL